MEENKMICSVCGAIGTEDSLYSFDGRLYCEDCLDEETIVCENCQERVRRNDAFVEDGFALCNHCYDNYYSHCDGCGRLIHNDDAYYEDDSDFAYCRECYEMRKKRPIKSYNYKPEPIFYGSGDLFFGVELEIDKGGEEHENAETLLNIAKKDGERIYCKHDGSITDGFEIVSHPMSLEYHMKNMNWKELFSKAIELNYRSHNTSTCGLHIHCSRAAFGNTFEEQEKVVGRMVFFVERHWNELVRFSRRTLETLGRWASRYATISPTTEETYEKAKGRYMGRYMAVNLENSDTVEIRLFRGTLRYETFIAALQLVGEICDCAINMTDREMEEMSWLDFVQRISEDKAELINYLKLKKLYLNDSVEESEEM